MVCSSPGIEQVYNCEAIMWVLCNEQTELFMGIYVQANKSLTCMVAAELAVLAEITALQLQNTSSKLKKPSLFNG